MTEASLLGALGIVIFLLLILLGMRIAFAAIIVGFLGTLVLVNPAAALHTIGSIPYTSTSLYAFTVIPMFILMGYLAETSGFATELFWAGRQWLGWLPGGLYLATIYGGAVLGAACGSSIAAAAMLTKIALPELEKYKYDQRLSAGCCASSGCLSSIIPPSTMMIIYGIITEQSVGRLLIGGILPGILIACAFMLMIVTMVLRKPALGAPVSGVTFKEKLVALKGVIGILMIAVVVMGGIYSGVFTPTEAGAIGAMTVFLMSILSKRMTRAKLWRVLLEAARATCMVFILIVGFYMLSHFLAQTRVTYVISEWIGGLPVHRLVTMGSIIGLYLVLGMFLDPIGMLILTMPVIFPVILSLGFDPIWFGVVVVIMCEVAGLTPPVGMKVFVVSGVAPHIPITKIFRGALPFLIMMLAVIGVLVFFPQIVLFLPNTMRAVR